MAEKQESVRNFGVFLTQIRDGEVNAEASRELRDLLLALAEHASKQGKAKGKLTLAFNFSVDARGVVAVGVETKVQTPKPERGAGIFWLTDDGNLSVQNPKQVRIPFRDVKADAEPKDVAVDLPARSF